jgi:ribosomal protein S18 acetylase RimI-like enzyme
MPSSEVGDVYIHPNSTSSLIPHLKAHLPYVSSMLYVIQVPPAPVPIVFATFPPDESPPESKDWAVGVLGITDLPESEFWFWSSTEGASAINVDKDEKECFCSAYAQFKQMLKLISNIYPKKETLLVDSLHSRIAFYLPISRGDPGSVWNKLVFSKDYLPSPDHRAQVLGSKYIFKRVEVKDLDDVIQTSTIPRSKTALAATSSTGAYLASSEDKRAQAWCFITREGTIGSVYVRPEARGMGLGKETVRKELEKVFLCQEYVMADVFPTNTESLRLCQSLGARWVWDTVWVNVQLSQFKDK